jgi:dipeptidase E
MNARVIAAGGGGAAASRPLDERFASWLGDDGRMLYWPVALPETHPLRASCWEWITSVFRPLGIKRIEMWDDLRGHTAAELEQFDAVYIGGGNTYRLLHMLRETGFDNALQRWIERGRPMYGGSAGAAILGRDIGTVAHMDQNIAGITSLRGLDVLHGHAIWCHYEPQADDPRIAAYLGEHAIPVLAISERSGLVLEDGRLIALGHEPAVHFDGRRRTVVDVGQPVVVD